MGNVRRTASSKRRTLARNMKQFQELNGLLLEEGLLLVAEYGSSDELAEDMWFRRAVVHKWCSNKFDSQKLVRLRKERSSATSSYASISIFCINYRIHPICRLKIGSTVRKFYGRKKIYLLYINVGNCVRTNDTSISFKHAEFYQTMFHLRRRRKTFHRSSDEGSGKNAKVFQLYQLELYAYNSMIIAIFIYFDTKLWQF